MKTRDKKFACYQRKYEVAEQGFKARSFKRQSLGFSPLHLYSPWNHVSGFQSVVLDQKHCQPSSWSLLAMRIRRAYSQTWELRNCENEAATGILTIPSHSDSETW